MMITDKIHANLTQKTKRAHQTPDKMVWCVGVRLSLLAFRAVSPLNYQSSPDCSRMRTRDDLRGIAQSQQMNH